MQINEYKRVLDGVDDIDLEKLVLTRTGNHVVLEYPDNPPERWSNFAGVVKGSRAEHGENLARGQPRASPGQLPPEHFLDGFVSDMNAAFGEAITRDCISVHSPEPGKALTARQVKQIIDTAEQKAADSGVSAHRQQSGFRADNEAAIRKFLKDDYWAGRLFIESDCFQAGLQRLQGRELLPENAAAFVRKMTIALCRNSPDYATGLIPEATLRAMAEKVCFIQAKISRHFRDSSVALNKMWTLLEYGLAEKGGGHVLKMWPVYMAAAQSFNDLVRFQDSPFLPSGEGRSRFAEQGCSPMTLASFASCHVEMVLASVEGANWLDGSSSERWRLTYESAMRVSRDCFENLSKTYHQQRRVLVRSDDLSGWQKRRIVAWLDLLPRSMKSFLAVVELSGSIGEGLVELAGKREPKSVFDMLAIIGSQFASHAFSLSEQEQLLAMTLNFSVAALTPGQARRILACAHEFEETTRQLIATSETPQVAEVGALLVPALRQRVGEASDDFQFTLRDLLEESATRRNPGMSTSSVNAVSQNFVAVVRNSIIELVSSEGQPILDFPVFLGIKDKKQQLDYLQSTLCRTLGLDPGRFSHRALLALLTNTLYLLQEIYWRACWETVFSYDASGMLYLSDGSGVLKLEGDVEPTSQVTLAAMTDDGFMHFNYCARYSAIRSVLDGSGSNRWLDSSQSQIRFDARFALRPWGGITLEAPVVCQCNLVPGTWPESKTYPQPIARDLMVRDREDDGRSYGRVLLFMDLRQFAESGGDDHSIIALKALRAIQTFVEAIEGSDFDNALVVYEKFIASGALDFLGNRRVLGNILAEMYPRMDISTLIPALNAFIQTVIDMPDLHEFETPERLRATDELLDLSLRCATNEPAENRWAFHQLLQSLYDPDGPLTPWFNRVPRHTVDAMVSAFRLYHAAPAQSLFSALEEDLVEFLGKGILPAFIESVLSKSTDGGSANGPAPGGA